MDENQRELVDRLCTQAGMFMEDASVIALTSVAIEDTEDLKARIGQLRLEASRLEACLRAAYEILECP